MTFENYAINPGNKAMFEAFQGKLKQPTGWLAVYGQYGGGKTHLQAALVNATIQAGRPAAYYTLADLLDRLRSSYQDGSFEALMRQVYEIDVLCIDECERADLDKSWADEKFQQIIAARYRNISSKLTVWVTNNDPKRLRSQDSYLSSRLQDEASTVNHYQGTDNRSVASTLKRMAVKAWSGAREAMA